MVREKLTPAMEDYLREAYRLRERGEEITVQALSQALAVTPPSVTGMVKRLAGLGLLAYQRYQALVLTPAGEAVALEVVRHHRLLELYLTEFLDMPWEDVHAEADRLEHHISENLEERIAERLGQPSFDPHGDPIPSRDLVMPSRDLARLSDVAPGCTGCVARVEQQEPAVLHYLNTLGVIPGAVVTPVAVSPDGVVTVRIASHGERAGSTHALGEKLAAHILVSRVTATPEVAV